MPLSRNFFNLRNNGLWKDGHVMKTSGMIGRVVSYGVGNAGAKCIAYISLLIYTYFVAAEELGVYDVILTAVALLEPVVSLRIQDATYRWIIEGKNKQYGRVIKSALCVLVAMLFLAGFIACIANSFIEINYFLLAFSYAVAYISYEFMHTILRGFDIKQYAEVGLVYGCLCLLFEIIGFAVLHMGLAALLLSKMAAGIICTTLIIMLRKEIRTAVTDRFDIQLAKEMLRYSLPFVPNLIGWWVINMSDRYIILGLLGAAYNGIYAVANKIPNILKILGDTYQCAWQDTAIREYFRADRDEYFTNVFNKYSRAFLSFCICAIPLTRIVVEFIVGSEYKTAWRYTGFLYLSVAFSALSSFLGVGYSISKQTVKVLKVTFIPAAVNVMLNLALINRMGLHAACFSTFVACLIRFALCYADTRKYFAIRVDWRQMVVLSSVTIAVLIITLLIKSMMVVFFMSASIVLLMILYNYNALFRFFMKKE